MKKSSIKKIRALRGILTSPDELLSYVNNFNFKLNKFTNREYLFSNKKGDEINIEVEKFTEKVISIKKVRVSTKKKILLTAGKIKRIARLKNKIMNYNKLLQIMKIFDFQIYDVEILDYYNNLIFINKFNEKILVDFDIKYEDEDTILIKKILFNPVLR